MSTLRLSPRRSAFLIAAVLFFAQSSFADAQKAAPAKPAMPNAAMMIMPKIEIKKIRLSVINIMLIVIQKKLVVVITTTPISKKNREKVANAGMLKVEKQHPRIHLAQSTLEILQKKPSVHSSKPCVECLKIIQVLIFYVVGVIR